MHTPHTHTISDTRGDTARQKRRRYLRCGSGVGYARGYVLRRGGLDAREVAYTCGSTFNHEGCIHMWFNVCIAAHKYVQPHVNHSDKTCGSTYLCAAIHVEHTCGSTFNHRLHTHVVQGCIHMWFNVLVCCYTCAAFWKETIHVKQRVHQKSVARACAGLQRECTPVAHVLA
jgi:hypothetical protein